MEIKGIARPIVDVLVARTNELSQGRNAGCICLVNREGYIDTMYPIIDGGISGLPLRKMLSFITPMKHRAVIEGMMEMPENAVLVTTRPGKTGLITDVSGVDFFNIPIVSIGVKEGHEAGIGLIYPKPEYYDLATESEKIDLNILAADNMDEEKNILRNSMNLNLKYLDVSSPLPVAHIPVRQVHGPVDAEKIEIHLPRIKVNSIDKKLAEELVNKSMEVGQGREVAMVCLVDEQGHVIPHGKMVAGGMGYVPSRILASSAVDITGKSLKEIYSEIVPENAIIVHTHPGGTGVMHMGDANAGPGTWGRPIIAIGHDKDGEVKGATVIELSEKLFDLADEDEELNIKFFDADTPEEEAEIRNRKFGVAQEYTNLSKPIEIK